MQSENKWKSLSSNQSEKCKIIRNKRLKLILIGIPIDSTSFIFLLCYKTKTSDVGKLNLRLTGFNGIFDKIQITDEEPVATEVTNEKVSFHFHLTIRHTNPNRMQSLL